MVLLDRGKLIWMALVASLSCLMLTGLDMSFNVYALLLKDTFQFSQTQNEIVACTGTIGLALLFLEPLLTGTLGCQATFCLTFLVNPLSSGFLAVTAYYSDYFRSRPLYIYMAHLFMCTSLSMSSVCLVGVNIKLFPKEHAGTLIGLTAAFMCLAKVTLGGLMDCFFPVNLTGFFLTISLSSVVCFGICYTLLYHIVSSPRYESESGYNEIQNRTKVVENEQGDCTNGLYETSQDTKSSCLRPNEKCSLFNQRMSNNGDSSKQLTEKQISSQQNLSNNNHEISSMLRSRFFHLTIWPATAFYACSYTCMNNITSISASARIGHNLSTVYIMVGMIIIVRVGFGLILDKLASEFWGILFIILSYVSFAFGILLGMFWLESPAAVYCLTVLTGVGIGAGMTIPISVIVMRFGRDKVPLTIAMFFAFAAMIQISLQIFIGIVYDYRKDIQGLNHSCFGTDCFFWSFAVILGITCVTIIVQFINLCFASSLNTRD